MPQGEKIPLGAFCAAVHSEEAAISMNLKETVDRRFCVRCCFAAVPQLVDRNSEAY